MNKTEGITNLIYKLAAAKRLGKKYPITIDQTNAQKIVDEYRLMRKLTKAP